MAKLPHADLVKQTAATASRRSGARSGTCHNKSGDSAGSAGPPHALANVTGSPQPKARSPGGARYMRDRLKAQASGVE